MIHLSLKRLFPILAISMAACTSVVSKPDYPLSNLYDTHWVNTAHPDTVQSITSVAQTLSEFDVIIFGEIHGHPGIHLSQMQLMQQLHQLRPELSLSLEQFERDTQAVLDEYLSGEIGEQQMRDKARAWDNYPSSYRPLMEYARQHNLPVIAANAPKDMVICVGRKGLEILDALPEAERKQLAQDIDISDSAYKTQYMSFLMNSASHGGGAHGEASDAMKAMAERSFAAQLVRDETMAESIALHLQNEPQRQVIHLTGNFHSKAFLGMVERLAHRLPELKIAVINPVSLEQDELTWTDEDLATGTMLLLVSELPEDFVQDDNAMQWSKGILKQRMSNKCAISAE